MRVSLKVAELSRGVLGDRHVRKHSGNGTKHFGDDKSEKARAVGTARKTPSHVGGEEQCHGARTSSV